MEDIEDLFDTSQYCTLDGNALIPNINSESELTDSNDFYQLRPADLFQNSQSSNSNVNLYGDEFLDIHELSDAFPPQSRSNVSSLPLNLPVHAMNQAMNSNSPLFSSWKTKGSLIKDSQPQIDLSSGLPRKICSNCGSISTPSWRRCPEGRNLLCNACGLYQKLHNRPRPLRIREDGSVQVIRNLNSQHKNVCQNCRTTETPIWRRSQDDRNYLLCNACALYLKNHNFSRPSSMNQNGSGENVFI